METEARLSERKMDAGSVCRTGLESFLRTIGGEPAVDCPELAKPDASTSYTLPTESLNIWTKLLGLPSPTPTPQGPHSQDSDS